MSSNIQLVLDLTTEAGVAGALACAQVTEDRDLRKAIHQQLESLNPEGWDLTAQEMDDRVWMIPPEPLMPPSEIAICSADGVYLCTAEWEDGDPGDDSVGIGESPGYYCLPARIEDAIVDLGYGYRR